MICEIVEWYLIFFNIKIYFYHVFPQCQYIDLKLLFRRWFGMHMKCARTFSSFKVYNNIICTVVQTLFVLYTFLHYLVYVTLYIRIFISVFPYTFGFNHNSITNPKTTIKGTQNKRRLRLYGCASSIYLCYFGDRYQSGTMYIQ